MSMQVGRTHTGPQAEISVTPLVDVCLVVLLIMMVVTPFLTEGKGVLLPAARNPSAQPEGSQSVTLAMDASGQLYLGDTPVDRGGLAGALSRARAERAGKPLRFQGDGRLTYGELKGVLSQVQASGYGETAFMVRHVDAQGRAVSGTLAGAAAGEGGGR